jgi:Na+/H+-translocating membrane pyrophosphatase
MVLIFHQFYAYAAAAVSLSLACPLSSGLGGSSIALFGRVGGGIYTKAADVGADLVGKVVHGIPEDDPRNPATIADNVGDNVGDGKTLRHKLAAALADQIPLSPPSPLFPVAGMGADLFGSYAESTCAALVIAATCPDLVAAGWSAIVFPMEVSAVGIFVCFLSSFLATNIIPMRREQDVESALKIQLVVTTLLMVPATYIVAHRFLPAAFVVNGVSGEVQSSAMAAFGCVSAGCIGGLVIGLITEFYTSHSYGPVREVANSCRTGSATNIIYGLALGFRSTIIPVIVLAGVVFTAFSLCDTYGVALGAIGFLCTLPTALTIDAYGPVCDNAGGIAEMAALDPSVREKTDALDAAGNTTAAVGKVSTG